MTLTAKNSVEHSTKHQQSDSSAGVGKLLSLDELEKTAVPASKILQQCTRSNIDRRQSDQNLLPNSRPASQERRGGRDRRLSFY